MRALVPNLGWANTYQFRGLLVESIQKNQLEAIQDEKYIDLTFSRWRIVLVANASSTAPLMVASNSGCAAFKLQGTSVQSPAVQLNVRQIQPGNTTSISVVRDDTGKCYVYMLLCARSVGHLPYFFLLSLTQVLLKDLFP